MTPTEITLINESLDLLNAGLEKLMQVESKNPSVSYAVGGLHSMALFVSKMLEVYNKV